MTRVPDNPASLQSERTMIRVLVCGGRHYDHPVAVYAALGELWQEADGFLTVMHGDARGADQLAARWCAISGAGEETFRAEWDRYGKAAGPIRNQRMLDEGKPDLVLAFPGGKGTADMVRRAEKAGIPIRRCDIPEKSFSPNVTPEAPPFDPDPNLDASIRVPPTRRRRDR